MLNIEKLDYNKNAHQLAFCKVCHNCSFDLKKGTVCSLTNKVADFEDDCTLFRLSPEELDKKEKVLRYNIYQYIHDHFDVRELNHKSYKWLFYEVEKAKYNSVTETHGLTFTDRNNEDQKTVYSIFLLLIGAYCFQYLEASYQIVLWFVGMFGLGFFIIFSFFKTFNYEYKTVLTTNEKGFTYKGKIYLWSDIIDFCLLEVDDESKDYQVILGTISSDVLRLRLKNIKVQPDKIIEILNLNIEHHYEKLGKKRGTITIS